MSEDFSDLSEEVPAQMRALEAKRARASSVDPEQLAEELSRVEFNSGFATDIGIATARVNDHGVEIHRTRNFPRIFAAYDRLRSGESPEDPVEEAIAQAARVAHYEEIFKEFAIRYPLLYARMLEVAANLLSQDPTQTRHMSDEERAANTASEEEMAEWNYISSSAYNEMARMAKSLDKNYNLENLYLRPQA